jgi:nitrous oxide reductase accessory protein NosL
MSVRDWRWLAPLALLGAAAAMAVLYMPGRQDAGHDHAPNPGVQRTIAVPSPHDPATGLSIHEARPVPGEARCPVCGMYPERYPRWAAQLIFADGAALFFDSPRELFLFLLDMDQYHDAHGPDEVERAYVSDAVDGQWVSIADAYFVQGSRVSGPMRGPDLPAFANAGAAEAFVAEQGGSLIRLEQITRDLLQSSGESDVQHP